MKNKREMVVQIQNKVKARQTYLSEFREKKDRWVKNILDVKE
ncbi:hypothetical protein [Paraliobacillus sediminis]|nr:hypothetical protein [Paraliobacillus sediminis]